jgi:hypothetical protein
LSHFAVNLKMSKYLKKYTKGFFLSFLFFLNSVVYIKSFSFIPPPHTSHSRNSFNRYHFPLTYMFTQYLHHIHYLSSFLPLPPVPFLQGPAPPSCSLILYKKKRKRKKCLLKIATQGSALHFHVYMYYSPIWFISSNFLLSALVPFLWQFQLV